MSYMVYHRVQLLHELLISVGKEPSILKKTIFWILDPIFTYMQFRTLLNIVLFAVRSWFQNVIVPPN